MVLKSVALSVVGALVLVATPVLACSCASDDHQRGASGGTAAPAPALAVAAAPKDPQVVEIAVTRQGFVPAVATVKSGKPVRLVVTCQVERTCATEIVMKDFGVSEALPLGTPVAVVITPKAPGQYRFACGMDMVAGVLKVE